MTASTVIYNYDIGSDTQCSGTVIETSPGSVFFGTKARARSTSPLRIGFYDSPVPDFQPIEDDIGSNGARLLLWYGTASNRQFSIITGVKVGDSSGYTGSISASTATLTVDSTSGMAVDDAIRIAGAGASGADLYTEISSIVSLVVTLKNNASTTVVDADVYIPTQVTVEDTTWTVPNADTNWAIGGRRKDLGSTQSFLDIKAGSKILFECSDHDNNTFTANGVITCSVSGNTTDGRISIEGKGIPVFDPSGLVYRYTTDVKPIIKQTSTAVDGFNVTGAMVTFTGLSIANCDEAINISNSSAAETLVEDCDFNTANGTITSTGISHTGTGSLIVSGCDFRGMPKGLLISTAASTNIVEACYFASTDYGIHQNNVATTLMARMNVFKGITTGIDLGNSSTTEHQCYRGLHLRGMHQRCCRRPSEQD